jgi:hypothetical protein
MPKRPLVVALGVAGVMLLCCAGFGCGSAVDRYEPNGDMETATPLVLGATLRASIGPAGDNDVFQCDMSDSAASAPFRVEVKSDHPEDLEMEVGISLPDVWEAITWPGWNVRTDGDLISLRGEATRGTLLVFVSGTQGVDYSIRVMRE